METALYPGTFDPVTNGHLDVLARACRLFEKVVLAIADNGPKNDLFPVEERLSLVKSNLGDKFPGATAVIFNGLVVEQARQVGAKAIIRGLRAISDFDYEFQMAQMNRHLVIMYLFLKCISTRILLPLPNGMLKIIFIRMNLLRVFLVIMKEAQ